MAMSIRYRTFIKNKPRPPDCLQMPLKKYGLVLGRTSDANHFENFDYLTRLNVHPTSSLICPLK